MNIVDGMDAARFNSGNPDDNPKNEEAKEESDIMPLVLRDLNNSPVLDPASPQTALAQMAQQPPVPPDDID